MCMEGVNIAYSIVLAIVEGRDSVKWNPITQTDTLNTFCEIQAVFTISTVLSVPCDTLYITYWLFH